MFLDASAVIAILGEEEDMFELMERLEAATTPLTTSPVALMETILGLRRVKEISIEQAELVVSQFMDTMKVRTVAITSEIGRGAVRARIKYGRPHKADLNLGDTFAYACAKNYGIPLLYKGNDFSKTDLG